MRTLFLLTILTVLVSCNSTVNSNDPIVEAKSTPIETLKEYQKSVLWYSAKSPIFYANSKYVKHKDEALSSLKIAEQINIPNTGLTAVLYSYNIGSDIIRKTLYMREEGGKYFVIEKYFSSYSDDPFKNGNPVEAKELLKKIDNWSKDNENITWM